MGYDGADPRLLAWLERLVEEQRTCNLIAVADHLGESDEKSALLQEILDRLGLDMVATIPEEPEAGRG